MEVKPYRETFSRALDHGVRLFSTHLRICGLIEYRLVVKLYMPKNMLAMTFSLVEHVAEGRYIQNGLEGPNSLSFHFG